MKKRRYTKEQLLFYLKKLSSEIKRTPKIKDMNSKKEYPSASTYAFRFGSWNNALKAALLKINKKKHTKKSLAEELKQLSKHLGRIPKTSDLKDWTASASTYRRHFGTWKKALKAAGLTKKFTNLKDYSGKTKKRKKN